MDPKRKIGILGGSYNPIHNSHLNLAKYLTDSKLVDEVWIMPCKTHALDKIIENEDHRVNMINLALNDLGNKNIKLCDIELKRKGKSYTIDSLRALRSDYPYDFYLVMGSDILRQIKKWHGYDELRKEADFIFFKRQGYPIIDVGLHIASVVDYPVGENSSTEIRARIKEKKSIHDLVPSRVSDYIHQHKLYQN